MCRIFEEVKNEGIRIGEIRGKEIGKDEATIGNIKSIMETLNITSKQAMDMLKISAEKQEEYSRLLNS